MIKIEEINNLRKKYSDDSSNKIRQRILNKVQLVDLIQDKDTKLSYNFSINIKTHGVVDQQFSGRCWSFAGLNILRELVIKKCNLNSFELSGSYIAFYDKVERFNILLETLITYKNDNRGLYDRNVSYLLEKGISDGGYFTQFAIIINKYGIVPNNNFPETFSSSNTYEINLILSRLLRKFYLELDAEPENIEIIKTKYMEEAFNIVSNIYGMPPEKIDFEYTDKKEKYHIDRNLTPKEFYDKYIGVNLLDQYVEISSYQDDVIKYNNVYEQEDSTRVSGEKDNQVLNISFKEYKNLILKQLKSHEPICFYCSTTTKRIDGIWIDTMERYGELFGIDLKLDNNSILKTNGTTNCHCMLITGADIIENKVSKWKIENSWGSKCGNNGYYIATDDWINKYVYRIIINKNMLAEKQLNILNKEVIKISKWDVKF